MSRLNHFLIACLWMLAITGAQAAVDIKGVKFNDTYQLGNQTLQLNGAGMRVKVIIDVYAAGLYVGKKEHAVGALLSQGGAKSMQIVLFRDLTGEDFASAMVKGFNSNNTDADIAKYSSKLEEIKGLMAGFGSVKKGAVIRIDGVPGHGIKVLIDGAAKGSVASDDDFYTALLKIWLGQHPVDSELKHALVGD